MARLDDMVLRKLIALLKVGVMDLPPVAGGTIDKAAGDAVAQLPEPVSVSTALTC